MMSPASAFRGRTRFNPAGLAIGAAGAALVLSACTALPLPVMPVATTPATSTAPAERNKEITTAAWEVSLDTIGQPVVTDGIALVYAKGANGLAAHAISVADGEELWTQPVHPGFEAPGVALEAAVTRTAGGRSAAIFLQSATPPVDDSDTTWWTAPVAFDLRTGKELFHGKAELVTTRPFACDDVQDMCFISLDDSSQSVEHWIDLESGDELAGPEVNPLPGYFRPVGRELYSVVANGVETLARVSYGEVLWKLDLETIFGKGATTDLGWHFVYSEKLDLYVGSVGINPTNDSVEKMWEKTFNYDLRANNRTVAFKASSGRVLWAADGAHVLCAKTVGTSATKLNGEGAYPIRCEFTEGYQEFPSGKFRGAKAKVVGYEPLTGKAVWETKPVDVGWTTAELIPSVTRGDLVIAAVPQSVNLLDTSTGKWRGTSFDDVFVCLKETTYDLPAGGPTESGETGAGASTAFPCTKGGTPVPSFTYGALTDVSSTSNGMTVISLEGKVAGFKLLNEFT
ncbi:hypothetical protein AB0N65_12615 [Paenarthrobacter sp. NPDC089322]|uniref:hypothetical protein n=1 Tax=Paenarthrobacter sp. NPDC089322 TaxID=3155065 RepID=UPI00343712CD